MDGTPTGITTPGPSGSWSNVNEEVLNNPQISKTGALPSDIVYCHTQDHPPFSEGDLTCMQGRQCVLSAID